MFWRLWGIEHFSYLCSSKLRHFYWWKKYEILCCNVLKIILLATASWNIVLLPFMRVYKSCSISNIYQTIINFALNFSYFAKETVNTKICKIHSTIFPSLIGHNLAKFENNKTIISFKLSVISKYKSLYNLSWALI